MKTVELTDDEIQTIITGLIKGGDHGHFLATRMDFPMSLNRAG